MAEVLKGGGTSSVVIEGFSERPPHPPRVKLHDAPPGTGKPLAETEIAIREWIDRGGFGESVKMDRRAPVHAARSAPDHARAVQVLVVPAARRRPSTG